MNSIQTDQTDQAIASDLYGRYDAIISVDEVQFWKFEDREVAANLTIKVFPGTANEYKRIKREIRERIQKRFGINRLNIEFDW